MNINQAPAQKGTYQNHNRNNSTTKKNTQMIKQKIYLIDMNTTKHKKRVNCIKPLAAITENAKEIQDPQRRRRKIEGTAITIRRRMRTPPAKINGEPLHTKR